MSNHCSVSQTKKGIKTSFNLTKGEFLALINALRIARTVSPVANDLSSFLSNSLYDGPKGMSSDDAQEFYSTIKDDINLKVVRDT